MQGNSRVITTNQVEPHEKVPDLVHRYLQTDFQKPICQHTLEAFEEVQAWLGDSNEPVVLDSCCGVGESTKNLATQFPNAKIIGVDKSALRIKKGQNKTESVTNYILVRADVIDFWRLLASSKVKVSHHFLLYPNPYPKSAQVQRRWHASPSFVDILKIGGVLEVRSNWRLYIEEFAIALQTAQQQPVLKELSVTNPFTPFERKYQNSGQSLWQVTCELTKAVSTS